MLIHVVDASGRTDEGGNLTLAEGEAPSGKVVVDGIRWVRAEIHLWVFTNVAAKRSAWSRRPDRLVGMFTGYGASPALVEAAFKRARESSLQASDPHLKVNTIEWLASTAAKSDVQLHRIVAHFVAARWPIVVALNKVDLDGSEAHVAQVRERYPNRMFVPTSAQTEVSLLDAASKGNCAYDVGGIEAPGIDCTSLRRARETLRRWGSTGVLEVISAAVATRPPTLVLPVAEMGTLASLGDANSTLRDCLLLKPLSTVCEAFSCAKRAGLCAGDLVRAEARPVESWQAAERASSVGGHGSILAPRVVKRDERVSNIGWAVVLRIQTNRKCTKS